MRIRQPEPLSEAHDTSDFDCGEESLNNWLRKRALANQVEGASRTFVAAEDERVVGYYALAASALSLREATGRLRRNMPDPVPVIVMGRLAVDLRSRGQRLGESLLRDATLRVLQAAQIIGIRGILVHALNENAAQFYGRNGFERSTFNPLMMMVKLSDVEAGLAAGRA